MPQRVYVSPSGWEVLLNSLSTSPVPGCSVDDEPESRTGLEQYPVLAAPAIHESNSGLRSRAATDSERLTRHHHRRAGAADRVYVARDVALEHRAADV